MLAESISLPHGLWQDGVRHHRATLRPLDGEDALLLWEWGAGLSPAAWTTLLLQRGLLRLGELAPVSAEIVRGLCVGDREALTLHLRRLTRGDVMPAVLTCPACQADMDLDLRVSDLLVPTDTPAQALYETRLPQDDDALTVRFRLPTGADQEAVAPLAAMDLQAARRELLARCILAVAEQQDEAAMDQLSDDAMELLARRMADLDPQADLWLQITCPECGHAFQAPFDSASYFRRELEDEAATLFWEVHTLAMAYHWPEADILRLSRRRRHRYLDMIEESLTS